MNTLFLHDPNKSAIISTWFFSPTVQVCVAVIKTVSQNTRKIEGKAYANASTQSRHT